jgi:hypothetical protein
MNDMILLNPLRLHLDLLNLYHLSIIINNVFSSCMMIRISKKEVADLSSSSCTDQTLLMPRETAQGTKRPTPEMNLRLSQHSCTQSGFNMACSCENYYNVKLGAQRPRSRTVRLLQCTWLSTSRMSFKTRSRLSMAPQQWSTWNYCSVLVRDPCGNAYRQIGMCDWTFRHSR